MPIQQCHRCGVQVPMSGAPLPWCPRCGGVLSAPVAETPWITRWVAHPPPSPAPRPGPAPAIGPTPRYGSTPQWGLPMLPWRHPLDLVDESPATRVRVSAATLRPLLTGVAVVYVLAAAAEGWRYSLLLTGRQRVLSARTVAISDAAVAAAGILAPVLALVAAVVCTLWLIRARAAAAEQAGVRDARSTRAVVLGVFLPVWNLGQAGVLLTELERLLGELRAPTARVRWWWGTWLAGVALSVAAWAWRGLGTVQAEADAVILTALADLAASLTAVLTLLLVVRFTRRLGVDAPAAPRPGRRWVASVPASA